VRESLDLKEITGSYVSGLGQPPFDPRMDLREGDTRGVVDEDMNEIPADAAAFVGTSIAEVECSVTAAAEEWTDGYPIKLPLRVRSENEYFDDIHDVKVTKDMLDLAKPRRRAEVRRVRSRKVRRPIRGGSGPARQQQAQWYLRQGKATPRPGTNVVDLMTALQQSLKGVGAKAPPAKAKKPEKCCCRSAASAPPRRKNRGIGRFRAARSSVDFGSIH
jgi:hypothetical protein